MERRHPAVRAFIACLVVEFLLALGVTVLLLVELVTDDPGSLATAIALTLSALAATGWAGVMVAAAIGDRAWVRGSAIVWQVLQLAIGFGALQGAFAQAEIAWPLIVLGAVALFLAVSRPVAQRLSTRDPR